MDEQRKLIFYPDWYNVIKILPDDLRLQLYDAVMQYKFDGVEPTNPLVQFNFGLIKQQIDRDEKKYTETCEKNRANAKRRWKQTDANENECIQTDATAYDGKQSHTVDANNNKKNNNNGNNKDNINITSITNVTDVSQSTDSDAPKTSTVSFKSYVDLWNKLIEGKAMPKLSGIKEGTQRRQMLTARIREYGEDAVKRAMENAAESSFLNGNSSKGAVYSFDWIIRPNNFVKVLEGNYNDAPVKVAEPNTPLIPINGDRDWSQPTAGEIALQKRREFLQNKLAGKI